jgi:hypothetical protein
MPVLRAVVVPVSRGAFVRVSGSAGILGVGWACPVEHHFREMFLDTRR